MEKLSVSALSKLLRYALYFVFCLGLFVTPFIHYLLHTFRNTVMNTEGFEEFLKFSMLTRGNITSGEYYSMVAEVYLLGITMLFIVSRLIKICRSTERETPFEKSTYRALKHIAVASFISVVFYIVKFLFFPAAPGLMLAFTFIMTGLISSVFSQLIKKAAEIKEENDYTV